MKCAWKQLLLLLPPGIGQRLGPQAEGSLQEIRLRLGQPVVLLMADRQLILPGETTAGDLQYILNAACRYSPWTAATVASGYVTAAGGHRIGLCGEVLMREGSMTGIQTLRSVNIRVARDFPGISSGLQDIRESVLIIGPPGCGKTTLLRDLIRCRSSREKIGVVDQRGEVFPKDFDSGLHTDVISGCTKEQGIDILLRTMSPDCIAVDEITAATDCDALVRAGWCGVTLLATAHAGSMEDLLRRPVYRPLVETGLFSRAVVMGRDKSWRMERIQV